MGHFAAMRWADPDQQPTVGEDGGAGVAVRLPEVFVGGEGLARGPAEVLATLLHEAAHTLAHVRGVKDTSRQGRWHNARFKALAEELGIEVTKDPHVGWSPTCIPADTRDSYAEVIAELGRALRLHRSVEITDGGRTKKPSPPACVRGVRAVRRSGRVAVAPAASSRGYRVGGRRRRGRAVDHPPRRGHRRDRGALLAVPRARGLHLRHYAAWVGSADEAAAGVIGGRMPTLGPD